MNGPIVQQLLKRLSDKSCRAVGNKREPWRQVSPWLRMRGFLVVLLCCSALPSATLYAASRSSEKEYFDIVKSIDLFGEVYRELSKSYVDTLNVGKLMFAGIDGMLLTLDPYTVFLDEEDSGDLDDMTSGQYAGIGVTISPIEGMFYITSVVEGGAAAKGGITSGDAIVSINNQDLRQSSFDEVKSLMKGVAGSSFTLGLKRQGAPPFSLTLVRSEVRVSPVSYSAIMDGIGYVELKNFSARSADDLREAILGFKRQSAEQHTPLKGVILDLRNNPGGLLTVAVDVASLFVNQGSLVLSIRGRTAESIKSYVTTAPPLDAAIPLAVLINAESASASEIVSGAMQDLDRGVIIGERSYGKGLVQSVIPISYHNTLKLTTAKYYTPSGRLIQKEKEAAHDVRKVLQKAKEENRVQIYYTKGKRKVFGGGGIMPDIQLADPASSLYLSTLRKKGLIFLFSSIYASMHPVMPHQPLDRKALMASFSEFLRGRKFVYTSESDLRIKELKGELKEYMKKNSSDKNSELTKSLAELEQKIDRIKAQEIAGQSERVAQVLEAEIIRHYNLRQARRVELDHDLVVKKAVEVLSDSRKYSGVLHP